MAKLELPGLQYLYPVQQNNRVIDADVVVYGGISGGVSAAIQARRMGKTAVVAEFSDHLGGMTTGGLGATDIGNKAAIGGISREFYRAMGKVYGKDEQWTFEPSVAEKWFVEHCAANDIPCYFRQYLAGVKKEGNRITEIVMTDGTVYRGKMFIDATYEGDLLAMAGVKFHVGREANSVYRETLNGVHFGHPNHNFRTWVDAYVEEGNPASGLLEGVQDLSPGFQGQGDACIQAYNFRVCLCKEGPNQRPFPKPAGYDARRYELLLRYIKTGIWDALVLTKDMPNGKTDTNNWGGVSSDHIGANYDWPCGSYARREEIFQDHVNYNAGMYWFLVNDPRVPAKVREDVRRWGLPADEFVKTSHWSHALYVREGRRMISAHVMTEHECRGRRVVEDPVGLAAYTMDSHNCRRLALDGRVINEGNVEIGGFPPYPISCRSIVPREEECANLVISTCLSSSHIAYGSIRMEPVFMILGQSSATIAVLAMDAGRTVQKVSYEELRKQLVRDGQVLEWKAGEKL